MASEKHCRLAMEAHRQQLLSNPDVQGVGVRELPDSLANASKDSFAVAVYVKNKVLNTELTRHGVIPGTLTVPSHAGASTIEVPVRVIEIGELNFDVSVED